VAGTAPGYCALLASALLKARVETAAVFARAEKRRCPIVASVFPFGLHAQVDEHGDLNGDGGCQPPHKATR
jgi:hypothetical protein